MTNIKKVTEVIGQVLGLVIGDKFTTPAARALQEYPQLVDFWPNR